MLSRLWPWRRWVVPDEGQAVAVHATTADGARLTIHHLPGSSTGPGRGRPPVMLLHGLSANRYTFHFPGRSLAAHLAGLGFDVYVPELRGAGASTAPSRAWDLDDYLGSDLPAILDRILSHAGADALQWVGHSMGGILLLTYGMRNPDAPIERGVTIGSGLDYRIGFTGFARLRRFRRLLRLVPTVHAGFWARLYAPLAGRMRTRIEKFNVWPGNIEAHVIRYLHANAMGNIPTPLLKSLSTTFEERGLRSRDGAHHYLEMGDAYSIPTLLLAGTRDAQVSVEAVEAASRLVGGTCRVYGRRTGCAEDYGHFDLILGQAAHREVWPDLVRWLTAAVDASTLARSDVLERRSV